MRYIEIQEIATYPSWRLADLAHDIGHTEMLPIDIEMKKKRYQVHLKLEGLNPTGSMKDRTGYSLIQDLEARRVLREGSILVESTPGNLGVALALQCKARDYRFIAVIDPKTTIENIHKMQQLGAQIDLVQQPDEKGGYLLSRLARVQEICGLSGRYVWADQYNNPANPRVHYQQTAREIYEQMGSKVDAIFVPVSTGGTLAGIGRFFRERSPQTRIIGVDAYGSVVFGMPPARRKLTGIGSSRVSSFIRPDFYDTSIIVRDEEAFACCRALYEAIGLYVGGSSGAVISACVRYLAEYPELESIVCLCADRGENYRSTIFCDEWLEQHADEIDLERLYALQAELLEMTISCLIKI